MTASQPLAAVAAVAPGDTEQSVVVRCLTFAFPFSTPVIQDLSLELPRGSRCLLTGANGAGAKAGGGIWPAHGAAAAAVLSRARPGAPALAGKTSLLQVLAGKYMVGQDTVR